MFTVYTSTNCTDCKATYRSIEKKGLKEGEDFQVIDVTADEDALNYVLGLGYQKVPVVVVGEEHWAGHRPDKLMTLTAILANAA